jgi:hypothetical protein
MLRLAQSCSCSCSIPNRHWYKPSDLWEEGEQSQPSDFLGSRAPVENEKEDDDDDEEEDWETTLNTYKPSRFTRGLARGKAGTLYLRHAEDVGKPLRFIPGISLGKKHKKTFGPVGGRRDALVYRGRRHTKSEASGQSKEFSSSHAKRRGRRTTTIRTGRSA